MNDFLIYEQVDGIVTLTMNRADERNALSEEVQMLEFVDVCNKITRDASVRLVILTGAGRAFSAGGNVKHMRDKKSFSAGSPLQIRNAYRNGIQQIPLALYNLEVPTIAAVNGHAIGAGMDLACMCDIRIASENAKFASSFAKLGIVPADGGAWLLSRTIGPAKALELMLTCETIDAHEAKAIGLVTKVTAHDRLMADVLEFAQRITCLAPQTLRLTKRLLRESQHLSLASSLELASAYQALAHHSADHDEAVNAFLEKRTPVFVGR
ncbi:crotonase/enoyl-CoA hydratase family protein [Pseudomonas agarici]|uniref:crotonase/enoyl-CoA hydratase family protein n=1 Tax=Pseudomonas agarici TaxID=46677 RepID=UPI00031035F2|nr:crotonase/enoyl-CoA hydratase family protein [Pseudomonas agarici]NWB90014.1 crotonase/enoyl-CoA hydratase family protein [Pseudomonas agarici]NWC08208.1 crotonase/enoyl-CoA hydratase family protein [Pseudomonas agarici]SEK83923.1 Enoyl-CoA hydratase/carnithine racemase [Pseudomonas agarici]